MSLCVAVFALLPRPKLQRESVQLPGLAAWELLASDVLLLFSVDPMNV